MKYIHILWVVLTLGMSSCTNYLEVEPYFKDMLQYDSLFSKQKTTEQWLWSTYYTLKGQGAEIGYTGYRALAYASDEAVFSDGNNLCQRYQNGEYSATDLLLEDCWNHFYVGIRKASIFINNVNQCRELTDGEKLKMQGEARFLRAYFYWMLMKQFGPVPLMPDKGQDVSLTYENLAVPRASYDSCVNYVVSELEQAAIVLPDERSSVWQGRATQGAALALRAKVLLYAASPLYNGNKELFNLKDDEGHSLISQEPDKRKWARAAAAAKELIDLGLYSLCVVPRSETTAPLATGVSTANFPDGAGNIDPFESYRQCFNGDIPITRHPEMVFFLQNYGSDIVDLVWHAFPLSHRGFNNIGVTLKQVDAYYMADGKDISHSSGEYPYVTTGFTTSSTKKPFVPTDVNMMFVNREPRFYASISYNNCIWENGTAEDKYHNFRVNYYRAGADGKQLSRPNEYPLTGIGVKKYYSPDDSWDEGGRNTHKPEPAIRYADVLLWYAEALNELGDKTYSIDRCLLDGKIEVSRNIDEMRKAFSQVRFRAGIPDLLPEEYNSADVFREKLKHERQIEFFLENSRYFDLRRWKDAPTEENQPIMGMNVDMKGSTGQKDRFYVATPAQISKVFMPKMYLWPLSANEIKRNPRLTQNPGW